MHATPQPRRPGMPASIVSNRAVQASSFIDGTAEANLVAYMMMRDLMERVMDEAGGGEGEAAATCADGIVDASQPVAETHIMAGARRAMHKAMRHTRRSLLSWDRDWDRDWACASSHASAVPRTTTTIRLGRRSKRRPLRAEPPPSPLPIGPGQHHCGFDPRGSAFRIASHQTTVTTRGAFEASGR